MGGVKCPPPEIVWGRRESYFGPYGRPRWLVDRHEGSGGNAARALPKIVGGRCWLARRVPSMCSVRTLFARRETLAPDRQVGILCFLFLVFHDLEILRWKCMHDFMKGIIWEGGICILEINFDKKCNMVERIDYILGSTFEFNNRKIELELSE